MGYEFNWSALRQQPYLHWLVTGAETTLILAACIWVLAFFAGSLVGVAATTNSRATRRIARVYVEVLRNIPPVVQLFLWYFVVPELLPRPWRHYLLHDMPHPEFITCVVALGLFLSARIAEHVRAGIEAVPHGTVEAAAATGLTSLQVYRFVRLPIAYRLLIPTLGSEMMIGLKVTALGLTIGVMEMTARAHQIESFTGNGIEAFTAATVFYALSATVLVAVITAAEHWFRIPR
ncbi:MAG: amino acid ABC transporter permease [Steroidobacteraceae bacterium]